MHEAKVLLATSCTAFVLMLILGTSMVFYIQHAIGFVSEDVYSTLRLYNDETNDAWKTLKELDFFSHSGLKSHAVGHINKTLLRLSRETYQSRLTTEIIATFPDQCICKINPKLMQTECPRAPPGEPGPPGPPGVKGRPGLDFGTTMSCSRSCSNCTYGPIGERGHDGQRGIEGPRGIPGDYGGIPGEKGEMGIPGIQGPRGSKGPKGVMGTEGRHTRGPKGMKGTKGARGRDGPEGVMGAKGENDNAEEGEMGSPGIPGPPGEDGEAGVKGEKGDTGEEMGYCVTKCARVWDEHSSLNSYNYNQPAPQNGPVTYVNRKVRNLNTA